MNARAGASPPKALVAAADSALRTFAFDRLAELGYRVDAVGDDVAVTRRLEKDEYALIVTDALTIPPVAASTRVVRLPPEITGDPDEFDRTVA